jgi:hypothetical protein
MLHYRVFLFGNSKSTNNAITGALMGKSNVPEFMKEILA